MIRSINNQLNLQGQFWKIAVLHLYSEVLATKQSGDQEDNEEITVEQVGSFEPFQRENSRPSLSSIIDCVGV